MKEFVLYTLWRFGLFVATYALLIGGYLLISDKNTVPTLWPLLVALVVSSIASVFLLRAPRERFAATVQRRATAASRRYEAARANEDETEG